MIHNPLLLKEFRQRMRTVRAPVVVFGYLAAMALFTFFLLYENVQGQLTLLLPQRSEQVFLTLSLVQMTVSVFLTPAYAAGSISGERERRTLAVLLTTPLSPLGILAGKIVSSTALLVLLVVVTLPLYSLVFLFGGAVPAEVVEVFVFQIFTILLVAALSVGWSTLVLRSGWSTVLSYATVAGMLVFTGVAGYGLQLVAQRYPLDQFLAGWSGILFSLNPLWVVAWLEGAVTGPPHPWAWFCAVYGAVCLLLMTASVWRLRPQILRFLPRRPEADERDYQ
ncbi:ABC transporter permease [Alicyclobacillus sp.]|uniref:ABC transporter permease n=1 Tax=Alicyclobacillus sp. TaxID=61169 RepID=UPI0025C5678E|nr:ABC transporter permease [Alicyclobacillus sp.]MCL6515944.1 ABC transporter permease [Alicyclobacillus sp.]